jgi:hypothetical protein
MYEHDVKCDHINKNFQIYCVDWEDFIDVEFERNDSFLIQNQKCFADSLQNRKLFDIFRRMIRDIVIDQYIFELAIVVSWDDEDIITVWYRIRENSDIVRRD